ncbi:hypothetical protein [Cellulomonas sp. NS3]|uniref:hypothetical protein n=1 Tax=Cellulomonas sp. NS3 TaxID=2973977 RepID=UPI002162C21C|nr:hypothetical protein [Cellulomonas sp. NS3]
MSTSVPQNGPSPTQHPVPHPPAGSRPTAPAPPRSTRGAKILTAGGALVLLLTLALSIGVARVFLGVLPLGILTSQGEPGSAVVASLDAPGVTEVELAADRYAVYVAQPSAGRDDADDAAGLAADLLVAAADGTVVDTSRGPQVTSTTGGGGVTARTVASFTITEPGTYTVVSPPTEDGSPATVLLAPDQDFAPFFAGIFGSILGVFLAIGLGLVGLLMLAGGIVWWVLARRTRLPSADLPQADGRVPGAPAV